MTAILDLNMIMAETEQLTAERKQRSQLSLARDEADRQSEAAERQVQELRDRLEQVRAERQRAHQQIAEAEDQIDQVQQELAGFAERIEQVDQSITQLNQTVAARRQETEQIEQQAHQQDVARRELEVRLESVRERAREQLSLEIDEAYHDYDQQGIDWEAVETEITELKQKIDRLGSVNVNAIDEQEELEQREVDLAEEIGDIDKARAELEDLIEYLNVESRNRFEEAFNQIRENFAGSGGLFRKLFGGGRADLVLMPDENGDTDWLESGIEIIAKPPGKEPQTIRLLSGGERTMVAVALLLSIFRSRPSPFCILDEVDAALDEANVDRFVNVIRSFLDHSHFIVITHHKRTMQAADQLYGITMPIRGVSKPVSVKFDQVSASGRLSADAMARAKAEAERAPEPEEPEEPAQAHSPNAQRLADLVDQNEPIEVKQS